MEPLGVEQPEDPRKPVMARHAVLELRELAQKIPLGAPEQCHVRTDFPAAQNRAEGDQENLLKRMKLRVSGPRVGTFTEPFVDLFHGAVLLVGRPSAESIDGPIRKSLFSNAIPLPGTLVAGVVGSRGQRQEGFPVPLETLIPRSGDNDP